MTTVAEQIVSTLAELGVRTVWGVVGDALNPVTDAIRQEPRLEWIGVRHEEAGAFAASAQSQLGAPIGVCMGTVGPGSLHLLNGLYDAKKSHTPVLAVCGQVPLAELGTDYFQEVDNDAVFRDVSVFCRTVTSASQATTLLEQALQSAISLRGVAVLTVPGDVGEQQLPKGSRAPTVRTEPTTVLPDHPTLERVASVLNDAATVTMLVGAGARNARDEVLAVGKALAAPMVLTLKAKTGLEHDNPYQVGQSGLIGNPASTHAFNGGDVLLMVGTDFPYREWYPQGKTVIQIDARGEHIGRRTAVDVGLVGDAKLTLQALHDRLVQKSDTGHLDSSRKHYESWRERQAKLTEPDVDTGLVGKIRERFDNPDERIRPEALAAAIDRHAASDAVFTSDTGMATVWLSRFVTMSDRRELVGSFNLGSMANAMPQALGAQAMHRGRQVIAFCGDGGLTMLLGDLITAVTYQLPVKLMVFNNGRLGMVKLEQEQVGLPEFGTVLSNPDLAAVAAAIGLDSERVTEPGAVDGAVARALGKPGPMLLDVVTNPDEIAIPGKVQVDQAWGFAIAKVRETLRSAGE